jgi:hypothetical protein
MATSQAQAGISFNISFGGPDYRECEPAPVIISRPAPVVYSRPAPVVCEPAPVVCTPPPVVCAPPPVVYRPAPVVYRPAPVVVASPRVVYADPGYRYDRGGYQRDGYDHNRSHGYSHEYGRNERPQQRGSYSHEAAYDRHGYRPEVADNRHY